MLACCFLSVVHLSTVSNESKYLPNFVFLIAKMGRVRYCNHAYKFRELSNYMLQNVSRTLVALELKIFFFLFCSAYSIPFRTVSLVLRVFDENYQVR